MVAHDEVIEGQQRKLIPRWNIATRIAFRFFFIYLGLFILYFCPVWLQDLLYLKKHYRLVLGGVWPMPQLVSWAGAHFLNLIGPLGPGVGFDGIYYWVEAFCLLIIAVLATGVWSVLDRRRENYVTLHKWFRCEFCCKQFSNFAFLSLADGKNIGDIKPPIVRRGASKRSRRFFE